MSAEARELYERRLVLPVLQTVFNLALYAALACVAANPAWQPYSFLAWPILGLSLTGFLAAAHDCVHNTFFDSKLANRLAGAAWCTPLLINFTIFKYPHLTHHRYTRVPGDTEPLEPLKSRGEWVRRMFVANPVRPIPAAVRVAIGRFPPYLNNEAKKRAARADAIGILVWLLVTFTLTAIFPLAMVAIYWGPYLFFSPMLHLTALPEHHGCGAGPDVIPSTRSVISNVFVRTILWNGNYHAEHHLDPAVPSCNLPELSRRLADQKLQHTHSYFGFHLSLLRELSRSGKST